MVYSLKVVLLSSLVLLVSFLDGMVSLNWGEVLLGANWLRSVSFRVELLRYTVSLA